MTQPKPSSLKKNRKGLKLLIQLYTVDDVAPDYLSPKFSMHS